MARSRFARMVLATLGVVAMGAAACTSTSTGPKTVVDNAPAASSASPDASSTAPAAAAEEAKPDAEIEPVPIPIGDTGLVEAKASIKVHAPIEKARATVLKFEDYPQFMPEYSDAKRLGNMPSGNEKVYMEITTLGGIAKMFANVEVLPVAKDGATEKYEAKFIDGNVKQFKAIWTLTKVDDQHTDMTLQVFLHPSIPLPNMLVNTANLDGAKKGVIAMKKRIEGAK